MDISSKWRRGVCVLAASLAATAVPSYGQTAAMTAVEQIRENYDRLDDLNVYYDITATTTGGGYSLDNRLEMNMQAENIRDLEQLKLMFYSRMTFLGQELTYSSYYEDGWAYSNSPQGNKTRFRQDVGEASAYVDSLTNLMNPRQELYSQTTLWMEDDNTLVSFAVAPAQMEAVADPLLEMLQVNQEGKECAARSVSGQYRINGDGYVTEILISADLDVIQGENVQQMEIRADIGIDQPGRQVEITMPDPAQYRDISS